MTRNECVGFVVALGLLFGVASIAPAGTPEMPKIDIGGTADGGGSIKGTVKFAGKQKKQGVDKRTKADPICHAAHADKPLLKETYVFGENDTLQNVFVYVSKGLKKGATFGPPITKAVMDQSGCQYVPHVAGVVVGESLQIHNNDQTVHNVKVTSKNNGKGNNQMGVGAAPISKKFKRAEIGVHFKCDVHPWMGAYLHVMDHPYFAVTQKNGTFEIKGLPPGEYELTVWHELKAFKPDKPTATVTVEEGKAAEVTFTYAPKKRKKK